MNINLGLETIDRNDNCFGVVGQESGRFCGLSEVTNGGKGSGNFGHSGRPGERGGSGKGNAGFTSRYADKESFDYDGETFYVDKDKRGGTTKDGKRTMMFPDEILYAREELVKSYEKDGLSGSGYNQALQLAMKLKSDQTKLSDKADIKKAKDLQDRLAEILRKEQVK